jgi:hypothetical protein
MSARMCYTLLVLAVLCNLAATMVATERTPGWVVVVPLTLTAIGFVVVGPPREGA